jgi:hypothetical protein
MALFDRNNNNRGYGYGSDQNRGGGFMDRAQNAVRRGWDRVENTFEGQGGRNDYGVGNDHLRQDYENRSTMDTGGNYGGGMNRGWNAGGMGQNRPMDRDGGLHQRNSWSDGAWTADAAERADREWTTGNRGGRQDYDRDTSPFQAGWRAGGMNNGGMSNNMSGGMGMNRGGMDRDRGWNLGGGLGEWGHTGNMAGGANRYDRGYSAGGGMNRGGGGFLDRAQNAVRRGWDNIEDRFDRDDNDRNNMHLGGGAMRGGSSWAGGYDRDHQAGNPGHYGVSHSPGMMGGNAGRDGMNRYGSDYRAGGMDMDRGDRDYDRGYKTREQTDAGDPFGDRQNHTPIRMTGGNMGNRGSLGRYDSGYDRGGRDWF